MTSHLPGINPMQKWEDLVELPLDAEKVLGDVRDYITHLVYRTQLKPIPKQHLSRIIIDYFRQQEERFAIYGSTAWSFYLPHWLELDPSDLDLKLLSCSDASSLMQVANALIEYLPIPFPGHTFTFKQSRHNDNRTLLVFCDNHQFLDLSILEEPSREKEEEPLETDHINQVMVMPLIWMLEDLGKLLKSQTAHYRRRKDLLRLARLYSAHQLGQLQHAQSSRAISALQHLFNEHQAELATYYQPLQIGQELNAKLDMLTQSLLKQQVTNEQHKLDHENQLQAYRVTIQQLTDELQQSKHCLTTANQSLDGANMKISELRQQIVELKVQHIAPSRLQQLNNEIANLKKTRDSLNRQLTTKRTETDELSCQLSEQTTQLQKQTLELEVKEKENDTLSTDLSEAKIQLNNSKQEITRLGNLLKASKKQQSSAKRVKKKVDNYDPTFDAAVWKHNYERLLKTVEEIKLEKGKHINNTLLEQVKELRAANLNLKGEIEELSTERAGFREAAVSRQQTIEMQGDRFAELIKQLDEASRVNEHSKTRITHLSNSCQLALTNFVRCQKYFQKAMAAIFYQNCIRQLSIEARQVGPNSAPLLQCDQCFQDNIDCCSDETDGRVLVCSYSYNQQSFNPKTLGLEDDSAPTSLHVEIPRISPTEVTLITGTMIIPLRIQVKKDPSKKLAFVDSRQVIFEDENNYFTICYGCLLDNIQEVITKHHMTTES